MIAPSLDTLSWYSVLPRGGTADVVSGKRQGVETEKHKLRVEGVPLVFDVFGFSDRGQVSLILNVIDSDEKELKPYDH